MKREVACSTVAKAAALSGAFAMLSIAGPAWALRVENLTTQQVIFTDNFENVSVGSSPSAETGVWDLSVGEPTIIVRDSAGGGGGGVPGDYSGNNSVGDEDYDEWKSQFGQLVAVGEGADGNQNGRVDAADYAVWRDNFGNTGGGAQITAYEGDHFLELSRPLVGETAPDVRPAAYVVPFQTTAGEKFRISFATYVPTQTGSFVWQFGGGDRFNWLYMDAGNGDIFLSFNPVPALKAAFKRDQWQEWTVEFELGSPESDWTLDGVTHHQTTALNSDADFKSWLIDVSTNATIYIDSIPLAGSGQVSGSFGVPEPNSLLLFSAGVAVISTLRFRRM